MIGETALAHQRLATSHVDAEGMTVAAAMIRYGACRQAVLRLQAGMRWDALTDVQRRYHLEIAAMPLDRLEERMARLGMTDAWGDADGHSDGRYGLESDA